MADITEAQRILDLEAENEELRNRLALIAGLASLDGPPSSPDGPAEPCPRGDVRTSG
jgi:hypothetical protein